MSNRLAELHRGYQNRVLANGMIHDAVTPRAHPTNTRATIDSGTVAGWCQPVVTNITQVIGCRGPMSDSEVFTVQQLIRGARDGRY